MGGPATSVDFELGDWLVEPSLSRISRADRTVHLRPKLMDLLVFLASKQGRVMSKDEILERVWHGEFVVESVLGRSIADLRNVLEDDAADPRVLETIPRRGYRLIVPVRWKAEAKHPPAERSIAVLPFADMAASGDQQYFCDGLAEELTNTLCGVPGLRVIARTSAFAFRDTPLDIREIGRRLGASRIVEGAVQRVGGRLRITVQLIDTADGCHLWSRRFDRSAKDLFAVEDEIALAVIAELRVALPQDRHQDGRTSFVRRHGADIEAHDLYLRGLYIAARRSGAALADATAHFRRAIERDPDFALAHAALADCLGLAAFLGELPPHEGLPRALAAARKAVQLDPSVAEGHGVLAVCLTFYNWNWSEAERGFRRAIDLNPSYSLARMWYSHLLAATGRAQEALEQAESAQQLDPWSLTVRVTVGIRLSEQREFAQAIARWKAALDMDPDFVLAHLHLGRINFVLGRHEEALAHLQRVAPRFPLALGYLGAVLGRVGRRAEANEVLRELQRLSSERHVGALPFALTHQGLGDIDTALDSYSRAFDGHEGIIVFSNVDPVVDELRSNPRFAALVRRLQLPAERVTEGT